MDGARNNARRIAKAALPQFLVATALCWVCLAAALADTLTGSVKDESGVPVTRALVRLWTVQPKQGTATYCPGCYADCAKSGLTDDTGAFHIDRLDPALKFTALVVREGFIPQYINDVDPAAGNAAVKLQHRPDASAGSIFHGQVVDGDGHAVVAGVVSVCGWTDFWGNDRWGTASRVCEQLAVTDDNGKFELVREIICPTLTLEVLARGMATRKYGKVISGNKGKPLVLTRGVTVRGTVLHAGRPVAGAGVEIEHIDRDIRVWLGHMDIATDENGQFTFYNVPAGQDWKLYVKMGLWGVSPAQDLHSGGDDQIQEVGELEAVAGHHIRGRVVLADGKAVPDHLRLGVYRKKLWDSQQIEIKQDGSFAVQGVPDGETVSLDLDVPNYQRDPNQPGNSMVGVMKSDIDGLEIKFVPDDPNLQPNAQSMNLNDPEVFRKLMMDDPETQKKLNDMYRKISEQADRHRHLETGILTSNATTQPGH